MASLFGIDIAPADVSDARMQDDFYVHDDDDPGVSLHVLERELNAGIRWDRRYL